MQFAASNTRSAVFLFAIGIELAIHVKWIQNINISQKHTFDITNILTKKAFA